MMYAHERTRQDAQRIFAGRATPRFSSRKTVPPLRSHTSFPPPDSSRLRSVLYPRGGQPFLFIPYPLFFILYIPGLPRQADASAPKWHNASRTGFLPTRSVSHFSHWSRIAPRMVPSSSSVRARVCVYVRVSPFFTFFLVLHPLRSPVLASFLSSSRSMRCCAPDKRV